MDTMPDAHKIVTRKFRNTMQLARGSDEAQLCMPKSLCFDVTVFVNSGLNSINQRVN